MCCHLVNDVVLLYSQLPVLSEHHGCGSLSLTHLLCVDLGRIKAVSHFNMDLNQMEQL